MISLSSRIFLALIVHLISGTTDLTIVAGTIGEDVVDSVIDKIKDSCVFQNDYLFLKRLAYVNSHYGQNAHTYRSGYDGGIWQVDLSLYNETQGTTFNAPIYDTFGIDWLASTWSDLRKPLFSGIAMMLLLELRSSSVPRTISEQGQFYESDLDGNASIFSSAISTMPTWCSSDNLDMAFLLDTSGSIGFTDFQTSKQFVSDVLEAFTIDTDTVRVAVTRFSSYIDTFVYFEDQHTRTTLQQEIMSLPYTGGGTRTDLALDHLRTVVFSNHTGMRQASAKIAIVQTDGRSNYPLLTLPAAQALRDIGVTLFAIGVGSANHAELHGIATSPTCRHVREIRDFNELHSIISDLNEVACDAIIIIDDPIDTDLSCDHKVTVNVIIAEGKTLVLAGFDVPLALVSFNVSRPSSALHSFNVTVDKELPTMIWLPETEETVFVTFDTSNCTADFVFQVREGNQLQKTGTTTLCTKRQPDGSHTLDCSDIDYVTSNNFTTNTFAQSFCASTSLGYHPHPDTTLQYIYCDTQDSYMVYCPSGFAYVDKHEDCSAPASAEPDEICDICTASNLRINRTAFPLATNDYQYVECSDVDVCELEECASKYNPKKQTCEAEKQVSAFCKFLMLFTGVLPSWC